MYGSLPLSIIYISQKDAHKKVDKRSEDDVMTIDACVELGHSKSDLQKINTCRIFLQVMTL